MTGCGFLITDGLATVSGFEQSGFTSTKWSALYEFGSAVLGAEVVVLMVVLSKP